MPCVGSSSSPETATAATPTAATSTPAATAAIPIAATKTTTTVGSAAAKAPATTSSAALEATFAKVFDLGDGKTPPGLDANKLKTFAERWSADMNGVSLEIPELFQEYLDLRKQARKAAAAATAN